MANRLFKTKSISQLVSEVENKNELKRSLSASNLTLLGVGVIVGAGIYSVLGVVIANNAGPAVIISFIISGISCAFAALCYAEYAAMVPVAGSTYTYTYTTLGEFIAWLVGWNLILEYLFAAALIAISWSGYVTSFIRDFGIEIPAQLTAATGTKLINVPNEGWKIVSNDLIKSLSQQGFSVDAFPQVTAIFNLPAVIILLLMTFLLIKGIKESATLNNIIVFVKVIAILIFAVIGLALFNIDNWSPFIPENTGKFGEFGWSGILRGAGVVFLAYLGFDAISTAAQESKNPQKDMPIGILGSLGIATIIYILVAAALTGLVYYTSLKGVSDPIAVGVNAMGEKWFWLRPVIKIAAIAGLTSGIIVVLMAQPRIFMTMAKDGLMPSLFAKVHPKYSTPHIGTIITGSVAILVAGCISIDVLGDMISIATLMAFIIVCIGIVVLRKTKPDLPRPFKTPFVPVIPLLGALICTAELFSLLENWLRLVVWTSWIIIGLIIYFLYGIKHSKLNEVNNVN